MNVIRVYRTFELSKYFLVVITIAKYFLVLQSAITPEVTFVKSGSEVSFECLSYTNFDNLTRSYEWVYPPELDSVVAIENEVLVVTNADMNAEVTFICIVALEGTDLLSRANSTLVIGKFKIIIQ